MLNQVFKVIHSLTKDNLFISLTNNSYMNYDLELDTALKAIEKEKAKLVCIQLPDSLKPKAGEIQEYLETNSKAKIIIWFGSCYGACDTPNIKEADLLIQWGHSEWKQ